MGPTKEIMLHKGKRPEQAMAGFLWLWDSRKNKQKMTDKVYVEAHNMVCLHLSYAKVPFGSL